MSENKKKDKKLLKMKLILLMFKEAQKLIHYENEYRRISAYGDKVFCGKDQQITPEFRAFNRDLNTAICNMEKSEAECQKYEKLIMKLKKEEKKNKLR